MSEPRELEWRNHAHWDHAAAAPAPTRVDRFLAALAPRLRRAHLPRHPGSSLLLVAIGALHFWIVGGALADLADMAASINAARALTAWTLLAVLVLPGLALVLTGAWDLARGPLRHAAGAVASRVRAARSQPPG